ncbi:glycosyltransferase family 2 protein [Corynebacterium sp. TAE3-ERU12]|uniref:glycosyltransferase family 2 protein n=1 Tax=Corynebacterium sp. TAE3-ERU12 TaxID=2849491 RepID=UPI001C476741|nr:glycosyltransferase family 2 protein [Corynebacterium sp. TAE3-ERU12]
MHHYTKLGASISIFDNESTDATGEIATQWPGTTVSSFDTNNTLPDDVNFRIKSTAWRGPEAPPVDRVICVDIDELIHHSNLRQYLGSCDEAGYDVVVPMEVNMVPPTPRLDDVSREVCSLLPLIRRGVVNALYSKSVMFQQN